MLANTAYESVKEQNNKSSEFELLRHIRNASSHQNKFIFFPKEPSSPAYWKEAKFDHNMKGKDNPFYGTECFGSFFGVPDIIDLLKDIEEKTIQQRYAADPKQRGFSNNLSRLCKFKAANYLIR